MHPPDGEQLLLIIYNMKFDDHDSCFLQCFSCSKESDDFIFKSCIFPKYLRRFVTLIIAILTFKYLVATLRLLILVRATFLLNLVNTGWEAAMCKPLCGLPKNCRKGSSCNQDIWSTPAFWSWGVSICCWYWSSHSNQVSHPWQKELHKFYCHQTYGMIKLYM